MAQLVADVQPMMPRASTSPDPPETRVEVGELDPLIRARIFEEVGKADFREGSLPEAQRCMRCYRVFPVITER